MVQMIFLFQGASIFQVLAVNLPGWVPGFPLSRILHLGPRNFDVDKVDAAWTTSLTGSLVRWLTLNDSWATGYIVYIYIYINNPHTEM